jgi:hypothetical protein
VGSLTSHNPIGLQGLLRNSFTLPFIIRGISVAPTSEFRGVQPIITDCTEKKEVRGWNGITSILHFMKIGFQIQQLKLRHTDTQRPTLKQEADVSVGVTRLSRGNDVYDDDGNPSHR